MLKPGQKTPAANGIRARVEQNIQAQAALRREIAGLKPGPARAAAEAQMLALRTDLLALNVEMLVRTEQRAGNG